jgi:hypothetical protein
MRRGSVAAGFIAEVSPVAFVAVFGTIALWRGSIRITRGERHDGNRKEMNVRPKRRL